MPTSLASLCTVRADLVMARAVRAGPWAALAALAVCACDAVKAVPQPQGPAPDAAAVAAAQEARLAAIPTLAMRGVAELGWTDDTGTHAEDGDFELVLRAPLGLQWVLGALVAGAAVLVAGALLLGRGDEPPDPPWVAVGPVADLPAAAPHPATELLLVAVGGRLRAFEAPDGTVYCPGTNRLEHPDGRVWAVTGRGHAGVPSLRSAPTLGVAGVGYVDPTVRLPAPDPLPDAAVPGCATP